MHFLTSVGLVWGHTYGPDDAMPIVHTLTYAGDYCESPFRFGPGVAANPCDRYHFWSLHGGGGNFLFVDGSVRFLPYFARDILPALASMSEGEVVALD